MKGEIKPILKNNCHFRVTLILLFLLVHLGFHFPNPLTLGAAFLLHVVPQILIHKFLIFKLYQLNYVQSHSTIDPNLQNTYSTFISQDVL